MGRETPGVTIALYCFRRSEVNSSERLVEKQNFVNVSELLFPYLVSFGIYIKCSKSSYPYKILTKIVLDFVSETKRL